MSRRTDARGDTLSEALTAALAKLVDVAPEDVDLELRAPGIDELTGRIRLELEIDGAPATGHRAEGPEGREDHGPGDDEDGDDEDRPSTRSDDEPEPIRPEDLDEEADAAADFLEGLLDAMDLPGDLRIRVHEDHAEVEVVDIGSGALIGRRGQTLEAIQELVRCALQREFQRRSRVKVDAEGYRSRRLEKLLEKAEEAIEDVLDGGEPERLEPMDVFERKAVHQLVASYEGVTSRSQGREPARRVIIEPEDA
jgi:spoIIIJ-associated protein